MVSERAYQRRRSPSRALRECKRSAGTHLCPDVVATLVRLHDEEIAAAEGEGGPRATRDLLTRRS
jgi:HD-GYP domain-containing protein (c-di-GMP phosphodiesterase class II)